METMRKLVGASGFMVGGLTGSLQHLLDDGSKGRWLEVGKKRPTWKTRRYWRLPDERASR